MEVDFGLTSKIWEFISQFVCWEFCRNATKLFPEDPSANETDLLSFFRDMVVQMTTKQNESDVTKFEALARFIEDLNMATKYEHFASVVAFSDTVKNVFPELNEYTDELISQLEQKFKTCVREDCDLVKDAEFSMLVCKFLMESYKLLPLPDLVQVCQSWQSQSQEPEVVVTPQTVFERLQEELVPDDVPKILDMLESGDVYKPYFDDVRDENGRIDITARELVEFQHECASLVDSSTEDHETRYYTLLSGSENEFSSPEEESAALDKTITPNDKYSLFRHNFSSIKIKKCSVVLDDVIKNFNLVEPYYASYIENLLEGSNISSRNKRQLSGSDSDFSSSKRQIRGRAQSLRKASSVSPTKPYPVGCRHQRKFICSACGKAYKNKFNFETHKCRANGSRVSEYRKSSSDSEWN